MLKLRELRNSTHLSQTEFAKQFNLTQGTYSNYENGTTQPDLSVLVEIAEKYQVSLDYLIGRNLNNEFGYLTEVERNILTAVRKMTDENKQVYFQESKGILLAQNVKMQNLLEDE